MQYTRTIYVQRWIDKRSALTVTVGIDALRIGQVCRCPSVIPRVRLLLLDACQQGIGVGAGNFAQSQPMRRKRRKSRVQMLTMMPSAIG